MDRWAAVAQKWEDPTHLGTIPEPHPNQTCPLTRYRSFTINNMRAYGAANISRELCINALNPLYAMGYRDVSGDT